jgi:site-specific recombinase XerD
MPQTREIHKELVEQPSLFFPGGENIGSAAGSAPVVDIPTLTPDATLDACALPYAEYLRRTNHSAYTITCFLSDLRMFTEFTGSATKLRQITRAHLTAWLDHLKWDRGTKPAPKTMARRLTFLKNLCGWLSGEGLISSDPAVNIVLTRPTPPLPELLFDDEIERLSQAAAPDVRCHLLVLLLLSTGLKKEEVMGLQLQHIDISNAEHPAIEVHFPGQAKRRRERRMELPGEWTSVYVSYLHRYQPREYVFECTDRNLNYVLAAAVKRARIEKRVTLQLLRDIFAVQQLRMGISLEALREKLGLSEEAWYETADKYRRLAFPI